MPPALIACPSCGCHARVSESVCPHCGEPLRLEDGTLPRTVAAVLLGLAVAGAPGCDGCGGARRTEIAMAPPYGVAVTADPRHASAVNVEPLAQRRFGAEISERTGTPLDALLREPGK